MHLKKTIIHGLLYGPYLFRKATGSGAFGPHGATYLAETPPAEGNPLKAALFQYRVKQFHGASCSVASVVTAVNAIRASAGDTAEPVTQAEILESVRTGYWRERMSPGGHHGRRGLPLPLLGEVVKSSLDVYGLPYQTVETVGATKDPDVAQKRKEELWHRLKEFEVRGDCLIIAHFGQGIFVKTLNIPHISPVGGFDIPNGDVTVLDVDPEQVNPYKVPFDTFHQGLFRSYPFVFRSRGYRTGGYVFIRLKIRPASPKERQPLFS